MPSKDLLDYKDYGSARVGASGVNGETVCHRPRQPQCGWASETGRYSRYYMFLYDGTFTIMPEVTRLVQLVWPTSDKSDSRRLTFPAY